MHMHKTLSKRIAHTITFLPHNIQMPNAISAEAALDRIKDLIKLLKGAKPHLPHEKYQDKTLTELDSLQEVFELKEQLPAPQDSATLKKPSPTTPKKVTASLPRVHNEKQANAKQDQPQSPLLYDYIASKPCSDPNTHNYNTRSKANDKSKNITITNQNLSHHVQNSSKPTILRANAVLNVDTGKL